MTPRAAHEEPESADRASTVFAGDGPKETLGGEAGISGWAVKLCVCVCVVDLRQLGDTARVAGVSANSAACWFVARRQDMANTLRAMAMERKRSTVVEPRGAREVAACAVRVDVASRASARNRSVFPISFFPRLRRLLPRLLCVRVFLCRTSFTLRSSQLAHELQLSSRARPLCCKGALRRHTTYIGAPSNRLRLFQVGHEWLPGFVARWLAQHVLASSFGAF